MVIVGVSLSLSVQIVCVPFEWRVKLFLIILVNAAVSVVVEVRHTLQTHGNSRCFSHVQSFVFSCSVLIFVSFSWTAGSILCCEKSVCCKVKKETNYGICNS